MDLTSILNADVEQWARWGQHGLTILIVGLVSLSAVRRVVRRFWPPTTPDLVLLFKHGDIDKPDADADEAPEEPEEPTDWIGRLTYDLLGPKKSVARVVRALKRSPIREFLRFDFDKQLVVTEIKVATPFDSDFRAILSAVGGVAEVDHSTDEITHATELSTGASLTGALLREWRELKKSRPT